MTTDFLKQRSRWYAICVSIGAALIVLFPLLTADAYYQNMVILSLVFAVAAVNLNVISGYAGYISLGHSVLLGIGAYAAALCSTRIGLNPMVWIPLAGLIAAVFAAFLGVVSMRARGASFVIITVAVNSLALVVAINWSSLTRGSAGVTLPLPPWTGVLSNWPFHFVLVALLGLSLLLSWRIRRSKFGLGLLAIREDEHKAATIGIDTRVYKILAFAASAFFVGAAGAVYGYYLNFVNPVGMFAIMTSVQVVLSMLIGGAGTLWGPVIGAFILEFVNEFSNNSLGGGNARLLVFGLLMVAVVLYMPLGIIPSVSAALDRLDRRGKAGTVGERLSEPHGPVGEGEPDEAPDATAKPATAVVSVRTEPVREEAPPLLELTGVAKSFGGMRVLDGLDLAVPEGSISGLIGPNGSGKTTAFNIVDGTIAPDAGQVRFTGSVIDGQLPWQRAHRGMARTFQITRLFRNLTVQENLIAPLRSFSYGQLAAGAISSTEADKAHELLTFVGLERYAGHPASELSYGQQKLVELAQVLMLDPKLVMLDEPAAGINPRLIDRISDMIRELNATRGTTFLVVEHNMPMVLGLCDKVFVLAGGRCIAAGRSAEVQNNPDVLEAYLGDDFVPMAGVR
ncbi:branched-chain amino acid ABC transporter ATP-binding protein/permease [Streptomyces sp. NPDC093085]|uniref:branched-chain amino acid ABC transporter ATP-binding protein/permease n=1 Tax=Streptomyces sp. NPDC093085 TaxID=3155068 RepID=UPI00343ED857